MTSVAIRSRRARCVLALTTLVALLGCETESTELPEWRLSDAPLTSISDDGTEPTQFSVIRGAVRLANGDVLVAEGRGAELRLFAADGAFKQLVARRGDGPDELPSVSFIARVGDTTLLVRESGPRFFTYSLTSLKQTGRDAGDNALRNGQPIALGVLGNGRAFGNPSMRMVALLQIEYGTRTDSMPFAMASTPMGPLDVDLGRQIGSTYLTIPSETSPGKFRGALLDYGYQLHFAAGRDVLWYGNSGVDWLVRVNSLTAASDTIALPIAARDWDTGTIDAVRERIMRGFSNEGLREMPLAQLDPQYRPDAPPYYRALHADINDGVWVELFSEDAQAPSRFLVLDADGRAVAQVRAESALRLLEIGADYLVGTVKDADDVETIVVYGLTR